MCVYVYVCVHMHTCISVCVCMCVCVGGGGGGWKGGGEKDNVALIDSIHALIKGRSPTFKGPFFWN